MALGDEAYSSEIASAGHSDAQEPHSTQSSGLMRATPSTIEIALDGQTSTQVVQPVHFALSTLYTLASRFSVRRWFGKDSLYAAFTAAPS